VRTIALVAAALLLAGCEADDGWMPGDNPAVAPAPPAETAPAMAPPPTADETPTGPVNAIDAHCQAVAQQRAADARANGYSFKMESTVYNGTYQECVEWDARHGIGASP